MSDQVQLGLGLVSIGRVWGHVLQPVPDEAQVRALLETAFEAGILIYDTAPAYGSSEKRLGDFLKSLTEDQRRTVFIATKFGEHWNEDGTTRVDHSYDALMRSLDRSVELLGDIDLVQVHKASLGALHGEGLHWALEGVRAMGIPQVGASVSDVEAGRLALEMGFDWLQIPFNIGSQHMMPLLGDAKQTGCHVLANRPLASGAMLAERDEKAQESAIFEAFSFVNAHIGAGAILTGTRSPQHLQQSLRIFKQLQAAGRA